MIDREFIDELASKAPTPGGGGASAYCGALASALASMVGNLTVGKKTYAAVEEEIVQTLNELSVVRDELIELIDGDAQAFEPLAKAYSLPKSTPEEAAHKEKVMQEALVGAIEAPLSIMRTCARVIDLTEVMAYKGSRMALSDAGVAAVFARAALQGASLNVYINVASLTDTMYAEKVLAETNQLIASYGAKADELYEYVQKEIQ